MIIQKIKFFQDKKGRFKKGHRFRRLNITNKRYGSLVAVRPIGKYPKGTGSIVWLCQCDCGKQTKVRTGTLQAGLTKSCGCSYIEHGHCVGGMSPTYRAWEKMLQRCNNPNTNQYNNYGGRGIKVCKRWTKFENFLHDMGEKPKELSLDRINVQRGYKPSNCRWATWAEQAKNKRKTFAIESFSTVALKAELKRRGVENV